MCSVALSLYPASPLEGTGKRCSACLEGAGDLCATHGTLEGGVTGYRREAGGQVVCSNVSLKSNSNS